MMAETESIDSEKCSLDYKLQEYKGNIPNLISRIQFNDTEKKRIVCVNNNVNFTKNKLIGSIKYTLKLIPPMSYFRCYLFTFLKLPQYLAY